MKWYFVLSCWVGICAASSAQAASPAFFKAIEQGNWGIALAEASGDSDLRTYAEWKMLNDWQEDASFDQLAHFIQTHPNWPNIDRLRIRAEKALFQQSEMTSKAASWLGRYPPLSSYGTFALAKAGKANTTALRQAWIDGDFDKLDEKDILTGYRRHFDEGTHRARIERLLLEDKATIAERLLGEISADYTKLYQARIGLIRRDRKVDQKVAAVPASLRNDQGLIADRAIWRDRKGMDVGAIEMLRKMPSNSKYANKLWRMRAKYARDYLEDRRYSEALSLLSNHGPLNTAKMADALWLRGWISLEYQNAPGLAYELFYKLYHSVQFPISKARGAYWSARAAEANGNQEIAQSWYQKAAAYPSTFYGQLAQSKLYPGKPLKVNTPPPVKANLVSAYKQDGLFKIAKQFTEYGELKLADALITHLAKQAKNTDDIIALVVACAESNMPFAQIRAAKFALKDNVMLIGRGWPVMTTSNHFPVENSLAHAIMRQESEFNRTAVSRAGAMGLMQLMPSTAKRVAKQLEIPYNSGRLFEPDYNMTLGTQYLGDLVERFNGSYSLAIAGYNAGPGRPDQWLDRFGPIGYNLHDTLNWLETIPFSETRNYVQRVLENLQIYRYILDSSRPLRLEKDLLVSHN